MGVSYAYLEFSQMGRVVGRWVVGVVEGDVYYILSRIERLLREAGFRDLRLELSTDIKIEALEDSTEHSILDCVCTVYECNVDEAGRFKCGKRSMSLWDALQRINEEYNSAVRKLLELCSTDFLRSACREVFIRVEDKFSKPGPLMQPKHRNAAIIQLMSYFRMLRAAMYNFIRCMQECGLSITCGSYIPDSNIIRVYTPCITMAALLRRSAEVAEPGSELGVMIGEFLETLAHELIHYAQFNGVGSLFGVRIEVDIRKLASEGCSEGVKWLHKIPYRFRPYEVEAYAKQEKVREAMVETLPDIGSLAEAFVEELCYVEHPYLCPLILGMV